MIRVNSRAAVVTTAVIALILLVFTIRTQWVETNTWVPEPLDVFAEVNTTVPNYTAANSTLGFQAILALSQGTKWRVDGLHAAARISGIEVTVPTQPKWSEPFVKAFQEFGPVEAHGAAMAWLGHLDLLKFVIQNGWGSALILEDDMDWSVFIRNQTHAISGAVRKLTHAKKSTYAPYGLNWDVLWLGHCSDPPYENPDGSIIFFDDPETILLEKYRGLDPHIKEVVKEGQRAVHYSRNPVCTFAYAVSAEGAKKLLAHASLGQGGAFDLMLLGACREKVLNCVSVNPEVFDPYNTADGGSSEVRAGDSGTIFAADTGKMGFTDNVLNSARCAALFGTTCLQ